MKKQVLIYEVSMNFSKEQMDEIREDIISKTYDQYFVIVRGSETQNVYVIGNDK